MSYIFKSETVETRDRQDPDSEPSPAEATWRLLDFGMDCLVRVTSSNKKTQRNDE